MKKQINLKVKAQLLRGTFFLLLLLALGVIPFALAQRQTGVPSPKQTPTGIPCTPGWSAGPDLPSPGVRLVGVYFPANGKFYVMGGRSMDGVGHDLVHPFEYDPVSNTWATKSASYPDSQVSDMACGVLNDSGTDYIYCVGGSAGGQTTATDRVFRYDPVTDTIATIPSPWPGDTDGITLPGGFSVFNNNLYILGGFRINTAMTDQIWRFTPGTNVWVIQGTTLPVPRGYIPTTTILNSIYTGGGSLWNGTMLQDTTDSFSYDPVSDTIVQIVSIPRATAETQALTITGFMWVFGGGETPPNPSHEVDVYDPIKMVWLTAQPFMTARRNFATGTDGASCVWLVGGYASDGTPLSSMETSCPAGPTPTPTATATPCGSIIQGGGSIVQGGTDIGNHGDDVVTNIALPFLFTLYDQTFNSVNLSSNGNAQFTTTDNASTNLCLPWTNHNYTILPYWDDQRTDAQKGCVAFLGGTCGIYTSVSGTTPNRIFNIEWRTVYFSNTSQHANYELRLYEGQTRFDVIYGTVEQGNTSATAGVQKSDICFTQYFCNGSGGPATGEWRLGQAGTPSPTPTPTATATHAPTATPTSTPTATPTATPTSTPRPSPTPRFAPTPRPRPTSPPRP